MIRFRHEVTIRRSPEDVLAFVMDPSNLASWNHFVTSTRALTRGPLEAGSTFEAVRKTDRIRFVVTEVTAGRGLVLETLPPAPALRMRLTVEAVERGARLVDEWTLDAGVPRVLDPIVGTAVRRAVGENLAKLKELLETGASTLQDGRAVVAAAPGGALRRTNG